MVERLQSPLPSSKAAPACRDHIIDEKAFTDQVRQHYPQLVRIAYNYLRCLALAEDAVQDGIMAAYKTRHTFRAEGNAGAWFSKIVARKSIDLYRKSKRWPEMPGTLELVSYDRFGVLIEPMWLEGRNPEDILIDEQKAEIVRGVINTLEDAYRIPLLLKDFSGFSMQDISEMMGISISNTKVRVHRARQKLKLELHDLFYDPDGNKK